MNVIFQFENHIAAAASFRRRHLIPGLNKFSPPSNTRIIFQDYVNRTAPGAPILKPSEVTLAASNKWDSIVPTPDRTVWVFDLDATGASTADSSYGLCVLSDLAKNKFRMTLQQFLESSSFLVVILTLYPDHIQEPDGIMRLKNPCCDLVELDSIWPLTRKIVNSNPSKKAPSTINAALTEVCRPGPKIVFANSGVDNSWVGDLIVGWSA